MSTRGLVGIKKNGNLKAKFNRHSSYPECLGLDILRELSEIKKDRVAVLNRVYDRLELVDPDDPIPEDQWSRYEPSETWGDALTTCDPDPGYVSLTPYINGTVVHLINEAEFFNDHLFCEYAYIVNLDTEKLEVYKSDDLVQGFRLDRLPQEESFMALIRIGEVQRRVKYHTDLIEAQVCG